MTAEPIPSRPRLLVTLRRSQLAGLLGLGALAALPLACSGDDAATFASASTSTTASAPGTSAIPGTTSAPTTRTGSASSQPTSPTTAAPTTSADAAASDSTASASTAVAPGTFPAGGELVVDFTYAAASSGRIDNPYLAVWVEDGDGRLVQTINLWYEQGEGERWLNELQQWYAASGGTTATSGATRVAGSYSVAWDGTGLDGQLVAAGDYVLYVESACEHGPHSITSAPLEISGRSMSVQRARCPPRRDPAAVASGRPAAARSGGRGPSTSTPAWSPC